MNPRNSRRTSQPVKFSKTLQDFLRHRELGCSKPPGFDDFIAAKFYTNFDKFEANHPSPPRKYGGIFNLEFSQDG